MATTLTSHSRATGAYLSKLRNNTNTHKVLRAVHPNAGVTSWFASQLDAVLQAAVRDAVLELTHVYSQDPPTVGIAMDFDVGIVWYPAHESYFVDDNGLAIDSTRTQEPEQWRYAYDAPSSTKKIDAALKRWGKKWVRKFDKLSVDLSKKFATRAFSSTDTSMKAALKDAGFTVAFRPTKNSLEAYRLVVADNVGLIRNLQASLYSKIQQDTWAAVRAGGDLGTLSQKLQQSYGIESKRAGLIARDQNAKAKAVLETTRRKDLGLTQAIWQHSSAGKVPRPTHVAMNGKVYELDKGMFDEDEGKYVFPGELINCRCTSRAVVPGVDDDD